MNRIDRAICATEKALKSECAWLRSLALRNMHELVGNRTTLLREGREFARSPKPPVEDWTGQRLTKRAVDAAMCVAVAALVAALIYAWPEPRHSDTLTVSDGFGGLK
jgi:hypothetical protein